MGCAKNLVDSEKLMAQLRLSDIELTSTIDEADIAVINTCGFIAAAKEESIDTIIEQVKRKSAGRLKKVYAMGCLTERYREELVAEIPEVDKFFGANRMDEVALELGADYKHELVGERVLTTPSHFAYLKISEGCDNPCSFCAIPLMRGGHVSRTMESLVAETEALVSRGVKEIIVIGQDTTYYGLDIDGTRQLAKLLSRIADVRGVEWVRLMYAYPAKFPRDVLKVIADHPKICKYMDIPIQHASDEVLRSMRRGITQRALRELLETVRQEVPGIALRTTLIVGYPNESPKEFEELLSFVEDVRFDRLGVFTYSQEDGTTAFPLGDTMSQDEKERRRALVMKKQQEISRENNEQLLGTTQKVVLDRREGGRYYGRTERDAPEIDNEVIIETERPLEIGTYHTVPIVDTIEYDLVAQL